MDKGSKSMNLRIPVELYQLFSKICIDEGITKTEGIIRYFKYLKAKHPSSRKLLDAKSKPDFNISAKDD